MSWVRSFNVAVLHVPEGAAEDDLFFGTLTVELAQADADVRLTSERWKRQARLRANEGSYRALEKRVEQAVRNGRRWTDWPKVRELLRETFGQTTDDDKE